MNKIKTKDTVKVIAGKDKGRVAEVIACKGLRVKVQGVGLVKVFKKRNPQKDEEGGIFEQERWLDISNVMLYDATDKKTVKVGIKVLSNKKKVRFNKKTSAQIDQG
jgi:large subunit ribosomal protein L24